MSERSLFLFFFVTSAFLPSLGSLDWIHLLYNVCYVFAFPLLIFLLFVRMARFGSTSWLVCAEQQRAGSREFMKFSLGAWMG